MCCFECKNLCNSFNKTPFLQNISFRLEKGDCLGLLGDNGSGKSTLMSICAGVLQFDSGELLLDDKKITREHRLKIGFVPQTPVFIEYLTAIDNLKLWKSIYKLKTLDNIPDFLDIASFYNKKVSALSGGMKKKLSIAIALMNKPDFLILDEAFAALDKKTVDNMISFIKNQNIGILYSSHNIYEISALCNKFLILKDGALAHFENQENFNKDDFISSYSKF